jgi:hypothetical protein
VTGASRPRPAKPLPTFQDAPTDRPCQVARRTNDRGFRLDAVRATLFGAPYEGVLAHHDGRLVGATPPLLGVDSSRLPAYVARACERLAADSLAPAEGDAA